MLHDWAKDDGYAALTQTAENREKDRGRMSKIAPQQKTAEDDHQMLTGNAP